MIRLHSLATVLTLTIGVAGCTTWVDVKKIKRDDSNTPGIRYSLPATFLLVQPQADGTASYSWVYLPDSDKTYAIQQHAFLAKYTLDVTLANGLLGKVNAQSDDTAVLAKFLDAAQSTYAAREQAVGTQKKTDATALATAKTALVSAQLALTQAQQESDAVNAADSGATPDEKLSAKLKLIDAQAAFNQAQATLQKLSGGAAADLPSLPQQWGPVLFRVVQDMSGSVKLVAVKAQDQFDTVTAAKAAAPASNYTLTLQTSLPIPSRTRPLVLSIAINPAIASVEPKTTTVQRSDGTPVTDQPTLVLSDDKKTLTVTFANGLPKGSYILLPAIILQAGQDAVTKQQVNFQIDDH